MLAFVHVVFGLLLGLALALMLEGFADMYSRLKRHRLEAKWRMERDAHHTCKRLRY
jgi:hypothetical protein